MKKGFTLIELLAVIVILAIIALIATPIVLDIIEDSKESSILRSAEMYLDAVELSVANATLDNKKIIDGTYSIMSDGNICLGIPTDNTCPKDSTLKVEVNGEAPVSGTITISNGVISDVSLDLNNKTIVKNEDGSFVEAKLATALISDAKKNNYYYETIPDFSTATEEGEYGVYSAKDDYGISYYLRGDVENNYVKFGKWQEDYIVYGYKGTFDRGVYSTYDECMSYAMEECQSITLGELGQDMYWRIIRINGDGTIRLAYDGLTLTSNDGSRVPFIDGGYYNKNGHNIKYVGYTYDDNGEQVDSNIKGILEKWYESNLESLYGIYVSDNIFCNDREITETKGEEQFFGSYTRLVVNKNPKLSCTQNTDKYTVSDSEGNGLLSSPIGLMTADEIMMAGFTTNNPNADVNNYLGDLSWHWTMSPFGYVLYMGYYEADVWQIDGSSLGIYDLYGGYYGVFTRYLGIRPVINLKADVAFTGTGTIDDPYVIVTE